jgi:hypothetical protein
MRGYRQNRTTVHKSTFCKIPNLLSNQDTNGENFDRLPGPSAARRRATHTKTARETHHDGHKLHDVVGEEEFVEHCSDEKGVLMGDWKKRFSDKKVLGTSVMADVLYRLFTRSEVARK